MSRISGRFGEPILDKYIKERELDPTAEEIAQFHAQWKKRNAQKQQEYEADLATLEKQLAQPDLSEVKRQELLQQKQQYVDLVTAARNAAENQPADDIAKGFIHWWKIERQLHREFGGRVIFQQFGPEALDARQRLFEKAEKDGDLKFTDDGVRHMFYYYTNMRHITVDEQQIEKPWFLSDDPP